MTRAVAWDVDGTLVDSEQLHHLALMTVSARYGLTMPADDARFIGVSLDQVWSRLQPLYPAGLQESAWQQAITAVYLARSGELRAFPGALAAMAALQRAGIRQCCVSNSARAIVTVNLAAIGALPFLEFALSRDDVARGKPDPAPYQEACRRLQLPAADVLVVEDSDTGLASARAAGCPTLRFGADLASYDRVLDIIGGHSV
jgi:HAD superfamily hydrolase (TIGR01509 family)